MEIIIFLLIVVGIPLFMYINTIQYDCQKAEDNLAREKQQVTQIIDAINAFAHDSDNTIRVNELSKIYIPLLKIKQKIDNLAREKQQIKGKNEILANALNDFKENMNRGINNLAVFSADLETFIYTNSVECLHNKKHPAHMEALRIEELKKITKQCIEEKKRIEYQYEYLLSIFPEIDIYVDKPNSLEICKNNFDNIEDESDEVSLWLDKDEYEKLPEDIRNQRALDNYIKSNKKSKWDIGRDYEMFCSYYLEKQGFEVERIGIEQKLNDLGRDIIAHKLEKTYIIQCKYWSQEKLIHEKHIAQLYGTTIQYIIENNKTKEEVIPLLVTNIHLSETGKKFANYLGVKIKENFMMQDFPRIKCNNNYDTYGYPTKIYHLPMDQQYDRTKVNKEDGDFYAFTVEEAVKKGYRRARKHVF
ncbi:MAG: hypothetical protein J6K16_04505 [Alphaproteobacteria bacterium]|nr:hypothetical protein [Alphaproteobacteria bacterium]